ncbi:MAG: hypothetical protein GIKADHBN_03289 [Phycisphaerales bacterium]|nr:hypothetical protein [Phycisphaerales bacterium]
MVLQQEGAAPIWGWADPGEQVTVTASWLGAPVKTTADANGRWAVTLTTPAASGVKQPATVTIAGKNTIRCENVALGEVWLVSGQSNMEWPVSASMNASQEIASADHPNIRYFTVRNEVSISPEENCAPAFEGWRTMSPSTAAECSAVGYYFAREISKSLGVPVGIIASDWGGTPVESWTSAEALASCSEYGEFLKDIAALSPDPAERQKKLAERAAAWWASVDSHAASPGAAWVNTDFSDSAWKTVAVPGAWQGDLASFDGFVYLRTSVDVSEELAGKEATLELAAIDDRDDAWVNGRHVGSMHQPGVWNQPRRYQVPAGVLKAGKNVVAVRVRDDQGNGGIVGNAENVCLRIAGRTVPLAGQWKAFTGPSTAALPVPAMTDGVTAWTPTALYNAMIHPLRHYAIRGALWYQGESNRGRAEQYGKVFPAMIKGWRSDFGTDFPFYFVQLAPFNYGNDPGLTAEIRDVQTATLGLVPNTGMACTMDIGDPRDIHPTNKQEVGRRLTLWALAKTYGKAGTVYSGPMFKSAKADGDSMIVEFDLMGSKELASKNGAPRHFQVAGEDRVFYAATAAIEGGKVRVKSPKVSKPVAVRYAWQGACETNLSNAEGLPAVPFRSDSWDRPKDGWPAPKE